MSQTPTARSTPAGSPAPRPPPAINLEGIYNNIPILISRVRNNQLSANQIPPLRNLLANHAKEIIIFHARLGRGNPIVNLPDILNPTRRVGNSDAITTETAFLASIQAGIYAARSIKPDPVLIAAMAAKLAAVRPPPAPQPAAANKPATPTTATTTPTLAASNVATPSPATEATPAPSAPPATGAAAAAPPAPPAPTPAPAPTAAQQQMQLLTPAQLKELMGMPQDARNARLESEPVLKRRFIYTCQFYSRRLPQQPAAGAAAQPPAATTPAADAPSPAIKPAPAASQASSANGTPSSSPALTPAPAASAKPTPPAQPSAAPEPSKAAPAPAPAPAPAAPAAAPATAPAPTPTPATPTTTAPAAAPPSKSSKSSSAAPATAPAPAPAPAPTPAPPPPPPVVVAPPPPRVPTPPPAPPPEPEDVRRKRKLREYMQELAPDLAVELGLDDVFSDVLDKFAEGVAGDAIRLAAHRNSSRVEVKDMAFVLDQFYQIVVPGFNAQVPKRVHLDPEAGDRKRGKAVMRRPPGRRDDE